MNEWESEWMNVSRRARKKTTKQNKKKATHTMDAWTFFKITFIYKFAIPGSFLFIALINYCVILKQKSMPL